MEEANGRKVDLVITTKFPTYAVKHSNKVTWLVHQHRYAYDLFDNEYGLIHYPDGAEIRKMIYNIDNQTLPESKEIYTISKNISSRLLRYNNINSTPLYHPPKLAERLCCEDYGDYILSIGRLDSLKRLDLLVNAIKYCDKNIKALIAGEGNDMEGLKQLACRLQVDDRVKFLGYVSDDEVINLYANCFAVYFAPFNEDYGYVSIESFLSKKPVITSNDSGGVLEFVRNDENGCVSSPKPEEIAKNINRLYSDKKLCREFGINGYGIVKDFTWDNAIEKLTRTL